MLFCSEETLGGVSTLSLDMEIIETQQQHYAAEMKFGWKSPQSCRKIELPRCSLGKKRRLHILACLLNDSQKAVRRETKQIES